MNHPARSPVSTLDLQLKNLDTLDQIADLVRASSRMSVFTGAGISTESGIPDYRGPNGVWARQDIPHIKTIRTDREARVQFWRERRQRYPDMLAKRPNAGHQAIARFERAEKLLMVVTQNIDGLHQKAGNTPDRVIELHGSTHRIRCTDCGRLYAGVDIQDRLEAGEEDPRCPVCGGVLRGGTVLFGEALPEDALRTAVAVARASDLMLVVGSSLVVNPAARLPLIAKHAGARLVILNLSETPLDDEADIRLMAEAGPALAYIADHALDDETYD
jgi:NAD-dependent deacetylase